DDLDALADIRRQTTIPIMVDEGLHGTKEMREVIAKKAADKVNIKLMKSGGIYPALKLVNQAEMAGMECQIGSMLESSIGSAAGAH
ncbi:enolase C-terminal domain-like protein, partial [Actinomadura kijaniata]